MNVVEKILEMKLTEQETMSLLIGVVVAIEQFSPGVTDKLLNKVVEYRVTGSA